MPFGNKIAYGHKGRIDEFVSNLAYFQNENVAISVTANGMNYRGNDIFIGIVSIYFNVPFDIPDLEAQEIELDLEGLKNYEGVFSSTLLPLKITLKVQGDQLYGQTTGRSPFPLAPFSKTEFRCEQAGIIIEFAKDNKGNVQYNSFIIKQGGGTFPYEKQ